MAGTNQHFIPQYNLKNFAFDDSVFVFDKKSKTYLANSRIGIDKIGYSKNFYDIDPVDLSLFLNVQIKSSSYVDELLEKYNERISAPLLNSFVNVGDAVYQYGDIKITSIVRPNDIVDFLIVQLFRTPFFRKQFTLTAEKVHEKYSFLKERRKKRPVEELARTIHGVYIIAAICNTDIWKNLSKDNLIRKEFRFIETEIMDKIHQLQSLSKTIWLSAVNAHFITSDNPIVLTQTNFGDITQVSFPLTKRAFITFWHQKEADKNIIIVNEKRKKVILQQNRIMTNWADRFIYSFEKNNS